jgi:F-type H+-transporting ATPase subunit epsilon
MSEPVEHMHLEVFTPTALVVDIAAAKVVAEGAEGFFALLPRHIDVAAALPPGLLVYVTAAGKERYLGVDEGVLIKRGADVRVSVLDAFESDDLASLRAEVADRFQRLDEHQRAARTALARLEAGAIRHVLEIAR